jgi:cellobiose-specific phosphotransferase system component IIA
MSEAQANGVPMMLADTGENARGLLAASARASGRGRTIARDALEERQAGLHDRVTGAIERDLGAITNPHQVHEALITKARQDAAPLYAQAYEHPGVSMFVAKVRSLFSRPAMRSAMARAVRIAEEEGRDPMELGFAFDAQGNPVLHEAPAAAGAVERARTSLTEATRGLREARSTQGGNVQAARQAVMADDRLYQARH